MVGFESLLWRTSLSVLLPLALSVGGTSVLAQSAPAPAAFDNQTNGFEPQGAVGMPATFLDDKKAFDDTEQVFRKLPEVKGGLGPIYNSTSCVACHQNAGFVEKDNGGMFTGSDAVSGTSSQVSEIRAGHDEEVRDPATGQKHMVFKEAPGGSLIQQRAIDPRVQERVPDGEDIRTLRMATSVLGDGFVECIADVDILAVRDKQEPSVRGVAIFVPVAVDPVIQGDKVVDFIFTSRVGRFGWKCQEASLLNFAAGAYLAEMGITNPLNPNELKSLGNPVDQVDPIPEPQDSQGRPDLARVEDPAVINQPKPEDNHPFGEDVEAFTRFMRSTKAPPRSRPPAEVQTGRDVFDRIGCAACHHPQFKTAPKGLRFSDFTIPDALGDKTIEPFSDFLLHDIGTGDGIVQTQFADTPPFPLARVQVIAAAAGNAGAVGGRQAAKVSIDTERLNRLLSGQGDRPRGNDEKHAFVAEQTQKMRAAAQQQPQPIRAIQAEEGAVFTTETANLIRTAPLWGLRTRPQLLHDGSALTVRDAIKAHKNQGAAARHAFNNLKPNEQQQVIDFLDSL